MSFINDLNRFIAPLKRRVLMMIARGVIENIDDSKELQHCQMALLQGEIRNDLERFQQYGFTSRPHPGAEGIAIFLGGNRDHGIIINVEDRQYRLKNLAAGEVAIHTDEGDFIKFKRGNEIEINTDKLTVNATSEIEFNTDQITINATTKAEINAATLEKITLLEKSDTNVMLLECATSFDVNNV